MVSLATALSFSVTLTLSYAVYVSNLDYECLKCICHASTTCDLTYTCNSQGNCGPFYISQTYWEQAGRPNINQRFSSDYHEGCARDPNCASKTVGEFMYKFGRDCNRDGVTDCDDYARIHFFGPTRCNLTISRTSYFDRYRTCRPSASFKDEFI